MQVSTFNGEEYDLPLADLTIKPRLMIGRRDISQYLAIDGLVSAIVHEYFLYDKNRVYRWCSPQEYYLMNHLDYDIKGWQEVQVDTTKISETDLSNPDYQDQDGDFNGWQWLHDQLSGMNWEPVTDGHPDQAILLWDIATGEKGEAWNQTTRFDEQDDYDTCRDMIHALQEDIIETVNSNGGFDTKIGDLFIKNKEQQQ